MFDVRNNKRQSYYKKKIAPQFLGSCGRVVNSDIPHRQPNYLEEWRTCSTSYCKYFWQVTLSCEPSLRISLAAVFLRQPAYNDWPTWEWRDLIPLKIYPSFSAKLLVAHSCPTLAIPWTVVCQVPLSMEFSRQELEWITIPSSRRSSLWDQTWVSCIAGGFFTVLASLRVCHGIGGLCSDIVVWLLPPILSSFFHRPLPK